MSEKIKDIIARLRIMRDAMDSEQIPLEKREAIKCKLVGALVAAQIPVPSSIIEGNPRMYFTNMHLAEANEIIGQINEHVVCNVDEVQKCAYDIWKARYDLVHYPMKAVAVSLCNVYPECKGDINFITQVIGVQ